MEIMSNLATNCSKIYAHTREICLFWHWDIERERNVQPMIKYIAR